MKCDAGEYLRAVVDTEIILRVAKVSYEISAGGKSYCYFFLVRHV